ncbi:hypothetical protein [Cardinium endosymbiont of Nabis limbatus]|uniref:hypothetical protein n=1 Tax=Cardinium endosymbiont of Nabis limbatus TaxID=3066217 RepID=UPI003AF402D5
MANWCSESRKKLFLAKDHKKNSSAPINIKLTGKDHILSINSPDATIKISTPAQKNQNENNAPISTQQEQKTIAKKKKKKSNNKQNAAAANREEKEETEEKERAAKAAEQKAAEQKAAEQKAAEQKAAEQKAAEQKAAEQKAAEQKAAEQKITKEITKEIGAVWSQLEKFNFKEYQTQLSKLENKINKIKAKNIKKEEERNRCIKDLKSLQKAETQGKKKEKNELEAKKIQLKTQIDANNNRIKEINTFIQFIQKEEKKMPIIKDLKPIYKEVTDLEERLNKEKEEITLDSLEEILETITLQKSKLNELIKKDTKKIPYTINNLTQKIKEELNK